MFQDFRWYMCKRETSIKGVIRLEFQDFKKNSALKKQIEFTV